MMETLGGIAVALVILYGGHQVISGARSAGAFFSFITALLLAYQPIKTLAGLNANLQEGLAAAQRLFTVLDIEPEIREREDAAALAIAGGEVRFEAVRFRLWRRQRGARRRDFRDPGGQDGGAGRRLGRGQIDHHESDPALLRRDRGRACRSTARTCAT